MIIPIIVLSAIFIAAGFIVTETNAQDLLSGYNTMSEKERENFDLKSYIPFFRKFHIFLGLSLLVISLLLLYFVSADSSGIFMAIYPILAYIYFIWKGNRYSTELTRKQKIVTYFAMGGMLILAAFIGWEFNSALADNLISVVDDKVVISGEYGTELNFTDIKSVALVSKLPKIASRRSGFDMETVKKGYFRTADGERVKLLINSQRTPVLLIITTKQKIYYSAKSQSNKEIYNKLSRINK